MANSRLISTYNETLPCSEDDMCAFYDKWASTYDKDYKQFGWGGPLITANTVAAFVHDKTAKLLDLASGTGLVCEQLRILGYTNIDAVDMSQRSLEICKHKQIYTHLMRACVGSTPLHIPDDTYDALVTCGSFIHGHLNQACFPEMTRIVKPGGIIVNAMRHEYLWTVEEFKDDKLENAMQNMVTTHAWEMLSRQTHTRYFHDKTGIVFVIKVL